jgi:hypothetical protein
MKRLAAPFVVVAVALACGQDKVRHASEEVEVVGGSPTVGSGLPGVQRSDGGMDASFGPAAPFQVDSFQQQPVQKVDILWVIDNSPGMRAKQDRLKTNIHSFMQFLESQQIDFHLGVTSTDIFDPQQSGRLGNAAGLPQPWINPAAGANAESAFFQNVNFAQQGGEERGFLAGMMALTPPLSPGIGDAGLPNPDAGAYNCTRLGDGGVDCFLRQDAPLYTIIVSDEEEKSCAPFRPGYPADEGCDDSSVRLAGDAGFGATDYWSRFYSGVKGVGGVSKLAAISGFDDNGGVRHDCAVEFGHFCDGMMAAACGANPPDCNDGANLGTACCQQIYSEPDPTKCSGAIFSRAQWCHVRPTSPWAPPYYQVTGSWSGCKSVGTDGGIEFTAYTGARYQTVAQATGGIATSICDQDYTPALAKLGLQAAGLRSDFPLSRTPISTSLSVQVTPPGGKPALIAPGPATWKYVGCENHVPVNVIRFTDAARPAAGSAIAASYDVNVRGLGTCP